MSVVLERRADRPDCYAAVLPDLAATESFGSRLAGWLAPGDFVALSGDLGSGKTELARAMVRALAGDPALEVPSPTFPILVTYEFSGLGVVHADLYRIAEDDELDEVGWDELNHDAVVLVEWPDRAGARLPADRIEVELDLAPDLGPGARRATLTGLGALAGRLQRFHLAERLVASAGFGDADRQFIQGDASSRSYTRLVLADRTAVLMNAPRRPDGPPVRGGLPYSRIVHLAEDVKPFVAMDRALRAQGLSAPALYAADLEAGLLVMEDLGTVGVVEGTPSAPVPARYEAAMDVLAALHTRRLAETLYVAPHVEYALPAYDLGAFLMEVELMLDWYLPARGARVDAVVREELLLLWRNALSPVLAEPRTWVLRDYHSPNLIWLEAREGIEKVGLIDFQDAVMGPCAYDVASLAQDARLDVSEALEMHLVGRYVAARKQADPVFDAESFSRSYAVMGAQRATKILGIFTRLDRRDRKPQYLRHIPRVRRYLARCLGHPELGSLRMWYEATLPSKDLQT